MLVESLLVKSGTPIVHSGMWLSVSGMWRRICYIHPTDLYWALFEDDPDIAHLLVMDWMERRSRSLANQAIDKLRIMYPEIDPSLINANFSAYFNELYGVGPNYRRRGLPRYGT